LNRRVVDPDGRHRRLQGDWDDLARVEPFWAILTEPGRFGRWDMDEFFATGEQEVDQRIERASALGLPTRFSAVLDHGCGVGRLADGFASRAETYCGVDVSPTMITLAQRFHDGSANCRFVHVEGRLVDRFPPGTFDLAYSSRVLQHLEGTSMIRETLTDLVALLRDGGTLIFQVPLRIPLRHRLQMRRHLYGLLRRLGGDPRSLYGRLRLVPMRMHAIPEGELLAFLCRVGATVIAVDRQTDRWGLVHAYIYARKGQSAAVEGEVGA
jgi:SAM-dependent methyltransferase